MSRVLLPLSLVLLSACATSSRATLPLSLEEQRLAAGDGALPIRVRGGPGSAVLRLRAREVPDQTTTLGLDLRRLAGRMEQAMRTAKGVGLAGPQVGLPLRVVMLLLDYRTPRPRVVFAVNPMILARADQVIESYEGCLSVPGLGGRVLRNRVVQVRYRTLEGETREGHFEGPNAILWQHELDHLEGVLYLDRLQGELLSTEEMRRRRDASSRPHR